MRLRGSLWYIGLLLFSLVMVWPGQRTIPAIDPGEARNAVAARHMAASRNYADTGGGPPAMIWLQAASATLLGEDAANPIWPYRLPSLLGAVAAVLACFRLAALFTARPYAALAAGMLACSMLLNAGARLATADTVLLACVTLAFAALWRLRARPEGRTQPAIFWIAIACGILAGGPAIVEIAGLALAALCLTERGLAPLRQAVPLPGLALIALATLLWLSGFAHAEPPVIEDAHRFWPGVHLLEFPLAFWPGSLLALLAIPHAWRNRRDPRVTFLLAWIVPAWMLFEAMPTRSPFPVLPLFPAIAVLAALAAEDGARTRKWAFILPIMMYALLSLAIAAALFLTVPQAEGFSLAVFAAVVLACLVAAAGSIVAIIRWRAADGFPRIAAGITGLACLILYGLTFGQVVPALQGPFVARDIAHWQQDFSPQLTALPVVLVGYRDPSALLWLGDKTRIAYPADAARMLADGSAGVAYVAKEEIGDFRGSVEEAGLAVTIIGPITGFDIARLKPVTLYAVARAS